MIAPEPRPNRTAPARLTTDYTIAFVGSCRGNPGTAYGRYKLVSHATGRTIQGYIRPGGWRGTQTKYEAEYMTLIGALEHLIALLLERGKDSRTHTLTIYSGSERILKQLAGQWPVTPATLHLLHADAQELLARFKQVAYVRRTRAEPAYRRGAEDAGCRRPTAPPVNREREVQQNPGAPGRVPGTPHPGWPSPRTGALAPVHTSPPRIVPTAVPRAPQWEAK